MAVTMPQIVGLMLEVVDEILLMDENLENAMRLHRSTGYLPELVACAPLAAALKLRLALDSRLYLIATGANVDDGLRYRITH